MSRNCILIVEDEMYLAMMLEDMLTDGGYRVLRAARMEDAFKLIGEEHIDAAVLDVNLHGEPVYPLAAALHERGVPFLFASAYGRPGIPGEYQQYPVLQKPYPAGAVIPAVEQLMAASPQLH